MKKVCSSSAADIETVVEPIPDERSNKRRRVTATRKTARHIPCAVAYKVTSSIPKFNMPVKWIYGRDCIAEFIESMKELRRYAEPILRPKAKMYLLSPEERKKIEERRDCHICGKVMEGKKDLDHDHQTGWHL